MMNKSEQKFNQSQNQSNNQINEQKIDPKLSELFSLEIKQFTLQDIYDFIQQHPPKSLYDATQNEFWLGLSETKEPLKIAKYLLGFWENYYFYNGLWLSKSELEILWIMQERNIKELVVYMATYPDDWEQPWIDIWTKWLAKKETLLVDYEIIDFYDFLLKHLQNQKSAFVVFSEQLKRTYKSLKDFDYTENVNYKTYELMIDYVEKLKGIKSKVIYTNELFGHWQNGKFVYTGNGKTFVKILYEISNEQIHIYQSNFNKIKNIIIFREDSFYSQYYKQPNENISNKTTSYENELREFLVKLLKK